MSIEHASLIQVLTKVRLGYVTQYINFNVKLYYFYR